MEIEREVSSETSSLLRKDPVSSKRYQALIAVALIVMLFLGIVVYHISETHVNRSDDTLKVRVDDYIYIKAIFETDEFYLRFDNSSNSIIVDEKFPRIQGSLFQFKHVKEDGKCFQLKTYNDMYLTTNENKKIIGQSKNAEHAQYFTAVYVETVPGLEDVNTVYLTTCEDMKKNWVNTVPVGSAWYTRIEQTKGTVFEIKPKRKLQGVNLGGWFIPEVWMQPSIFNNTGLGWGGSLCALVNYSRPEAEHRMRKNLEEWITEEDFKQIKALGFDSVRLPIGYWNVIKDPYDLYAPSDLNISHKYVNFALDMAEKYELDILVDLHGAPGSQNGQDHSGCGNSIIGPNELWSKKKNIKLSLKALEAIMQKFGHHSRFWGIEVLNEPAMTLEEDMHSVLANYYEEAYKLVRQYSPSVVFVFNDIYKWTLNRWDYFMLENSYYNVALDFHLYDWGPPGGTEPESVHYSNVKTWQNLIRNNSVFHPIIVGEWSYSTGKGRPWDQQFVTDQVAAFEKTFGWFIWNWKVERNCGYDDWDVQYQASLGDNGLNAIDCCQDDTPPIDVDNQINGKVDRLRTATKNSNVVQTENLSGSGGVGGGGGASPGAWATSNISHKGNDYHGSASAHAGDYGNSGGGGGAGVYVFNGHGNYPTSFDFMEGGGGLGGGVGPGVKGKGNLSLNLDESDDAIKASLSGDVVGITGIENTGGGGGFGMVSSLGSNQHNIEGGGGGGAGEGARASTTIEIDLNVNRDSMKIDMSGVSNAGLGATGTAGGGGYVIGH